MSIDSTPIRSAQIEESHRACAGSTPPNSKKKCKIAPSPAAKGMVAAIITGLALGILFGPLAGIAGFILGFASSYLSSRFCIEMKTPQPKSTPPQNGSENDNLTELTDEQIQQKLTTILLRLDENREKRNLLHAQAVESRMRLQLAIDPK